MAATTTPPISSVVDRLSALYPDLTFQPNSKFSWQPSKKMVLYEPGGNYAELLHEVGHALLNHQSYARDIELLDMERNAWEKARLLATTLELTISDDFIEDHLDSYREWLHTKSTCITCGETGIEVAKQRYQCLSCQTTWRVNDARQQQHRRYKL